MIGSRADIRALVLAGIIVAAVLVIRVTRFIVLRIVFGKDRKRRMRVPWRFSLSALVLLMILAAVVLGLFRDFPAVALLLVCCLFVLWSTIARYIEFRQVLAERRHKELGAALGASKERE